jgi:hypothetical protein
MTRSPRLAELVAHLTGCDPTRAVSAVRAATTSQPPAVDPLAIVARAMCSLRRVDLTEPVDLRDPAQTEVDAS